MQNNGAAVDIIVLALTAFITFDGDDTSQRYIGAVKNKSTRMSEHHFNS